MLAHVGKRSLWALVFGSLCLGILPSQAYAQGITERYQTLRTMQPRYWKGHLGGGYYSGDRELATDDKLANLVPAFGVEGGYVLTERHSLGLFFRLGNFTNTLRNKGDFTTIQPSASSSWRAVFGIVGRMNLPDFGEKLRPYVQGGLSLVYGRINNHHAGGYGPRLGVGLEYDLRPDLRVFSEVNAIPVYPDRAVDLAGPLNSTDILSFFDVGVTYTVRPRFRAVAISNAASPERLLVDEPGIFGAEVNLDEATGPVRARWLFGDGTEAQGLVVNHAYTTPGQYNVIFVGENAGGAQTRTFTVDVDRAPARAKIAEVEVAPERPEAGETVYLRPTITGSRPVYCKWTLSDGTTLEGCDIQHAFSDARLYTIQLEVRNGGGEDRYSQNLLVQKPANPACGPQIAFIDTYFDAGVHTLDLNARSGLRQNLLQLAECSTTDIVVTGYAMQGEADPDGLMRKRAEAVVEYYTTLGLPSQRLRVALGGVVNNVAPGQARWQYRYAETRFAGPED
ncbi:MAG: PKD domain-containing protein [Bacteroidota bacterium]